MSEPDADDPSPVPEPFPEETAYEPSPVSMLERDAASEPEPEPEPYSVSEELIKIRKHHYLPELESAEVTSEFEDQTKKYSEHDEVPSIKFQRKKVHVWPFDSDNIDDAVEDDDKPEYERGYYDQSEEE